jgi:hypothetical protein
MSDRGGHKNRISREQREAIVQTFLNNGIDAAQAIATKLGLHQQYALRLVRARGMA